MSVLIGGINVRDVVANATKGLLEAFDLVSKQQAFYPDEGSPASAPAIRRYATSPFEGIMETKRKFLNGQATGETFVQITAVAGSLPAGIVPQMGDEVVARGKRRQVVSVSCDPAVASYTLIVR